MKSVVTSSVVIIDRVASTMEELKLVTGVVIGTIDAGVQADYSIVFEAQITTEGDSYYNQPDSGQFATIEEARQFIIDFIKAGVA